MKEIILNEICDLVTGFLYYDRKDDEELNAQDLKDAITNGVISINDIVEHFKSQLIEQLNNE